MSQIFISVNIDAITLAETKPGGSWDNPTSLGSYSQSDVYIEMMAQGSAVVNNQGQSELTVQANSGDEIIFTVSAPGAGQNYYPVLYNAELNNTPANIIHDAGMSMAKWTNYCLQSGGMGEEPVFGDTIPAGYPSAGSANTFYCPRWKLDVNGAGQTQYYMSFAILDTQTGAAVGYYVWDPFINVNN